MYKTSTFKSVKLNLASPENILKWSNGEVIIGKSKVNELLKDSKKFFPLLNSQKKTK